RRETLGDAAWLALAAELCRPFATLRDAHPVPELVSLACGDSSLAALVALRSATDGATRDDHVRDVLARALPRVATLLDELAFFADYPLIVMAGGVAEAWMGAYRDRRAAVPVRGARLGDGEAALLTADGVPALALSPYVQVAAPAPGAAPHLFFL